MFSRNRSFVRALCAVSLLLALAAPAQYRERQPASARDQWQQPARVLDALGVEAGSSVADVGAGPGYFTVRMAELVGNAGRVYAVDISEQAVRDLRQRVEKEGLKQVEVIHSTADDPRLPAEALDAALVVNAYHEFKQHDAMLAGIKSALKPGGRLGIIDKVGREDRSREANEQRHELPLRFARADLERNGFADVREQPGFEPSDPDRSGEKWWFLVARKPLH